MHNLPGLLGDIKYPSQAVLYHGQLRADYSVFSAIFLSITGFFKRENHSDHESNVSWLKNMQSK